MKIELRNVKHVAALSEETNCFTATIYVDGKKAGEASNRGYGGNTDIHPNDLRERLNAYAKTLPPVETDLMNGGERFTYQPDAESIIDGLIDDYLVERELTRTIRSKVLFIAKDGKLRATRKQTPDVLARWLGPELEDTLKTFGVERGAILNLMPPADALAAYRRHG